MLLTRHLFWGVTLSCGVSLGGACLGDPEPVADEPTGSAGSSSADEPADSTGSSSADEPAGSAGSSSASCEASSNTDGCTTYINSPDGLSGNLAEHYVDFSFVYPSTWELIPQYGSNYVRVDRLDQNYTVENFTVGTVWGLSDALPLEAATAISSLLGPMLPGYREIAQQPTIIGTHAGYEVLFEGSVADTGRGDITLWGRAVVLPLEGTDRGVLLLAMATSLDPTIQSAEDVGVKGQLPVILSSFSLGKN